MKSYNVGNLARLAAVSLACWAGAGAITASAQQADETMPDLTTLADGPVRWYWEGRQAHQAGDFAVSRKKFTRVYTWKDSAGKRHSLHIKALYWLARAYHDEALGEMADEVAVKYLSRAGKYYRAIIKRQPDVMPDLLIRQGETQLLTGKVGLGIETLNKAASDADGEPLRFRAKAILAELAAGKNPKAAVMAGRAAEAKARKKAQAQPVAIRQPTDRPVEPAPAQPVRPDKPPQPATPSKSAEMQPAKPTQPALPVVPVRPVTGTPSLNQPIELTDEGQEGPAQATDSQELATHRTICYRRFGEMFIDGSISERAWKAAERIRLSEFPGYNPLLGPRQNTEVRTLYDDHFLFISIRAHDSDIEGPIKERDSQEIQHSERIGIMLQPKPGLDEYYCLEITPAGGLLDFKVTFRRGPGNRIVGKEVDTSWNCAGIFVVARKTGGAGFARYRRRYSGYTIELAIPLKSLIGDEAPLQAAPLWGLGLYRVDINRKMYGSSRPLYAMWKAAPRVRRRPELHSLDSLGVLEFGPLRAEQ